MPQEDDPKVEKQSLTLIRENVPIECTAMHSKEAEKWSNTPMRSIENSRNE